MPSPDRVALAQERLAARGRRIQLIRRRIVAGTLSAFVLAWGIIAFNGPMGEPTSAATAQVSSSSSSSDTTASSSEDSTQSADTTSSDDTTSSSSSDDDATAPMTTSQS